MYKAQDSGNRRPHRRAVICLFRKRQGPAARRIASEDDVADVIELLRLNYGEAQRRTTPRGLRLTPDRLGWG
jgi:hypothetical protein